MSDFWQKLKKPITVLAPLSGVTDAAFRKIISKYGKPDAVYTEFVSCAGLCSIGRERLMHDLWYDEIERPVIAQIFGARPDDFYETAKLCVDLGFDGIDINMGCPDKSVNKQGAGCALIKTPKLAQDVILATKRGAGDLPVSVKTRLGFLENQIDEWVPYLLDTEPAVLTMHLRTRKEMSKVPAHWEQMGRLVEIAKDMKSESLLFGNGDVHTVAQAHELCHKYDADGWMIGRGIFGNPWLFNNETDREDVSYEERLAVMLEHSKLYEELFHDKKGYALMRKHYKAYTIGFPEAKELRAKLMSSLNYQEVSENCQNYLESVLQQQ